MQNAVFKKLAELQADSMSQVEHDL